MVMINKEMAEKVVKALNEKKKSDEKGKQNCKLRLHDNESYDYASSEI